MRDNIAMKVTLIAAQSLDGWITRHDQAGDAFGSDADKMHFRAEIRKYDACVMGRPTYDFSKDRMRPQMLPGLRRVIWTRSPEAFQADMIPGVLEFTAETPHEIAARLARDGRQHCALLGGGAVNAAWLAAGLVDEVCVTIESRIFGFGTALAGHRPAAIPHGADAHGNVAGPTALDIALELLDATTLAPGGPLLLRYSVKR